ncbi:MAG: hypothetical protein LBE31_08295 [Deltaproteobacteria bacterium]|nr:hypothetical protein [Deltaproteobacteria bacterium]
MLFILPYLAIKRSLSISFGPKASQNNKENTEKKWAAIFEQTNLEGQLKVIYLRAIFFAISGLGAFLLILPFGGIWLAVMPLFPALTGVITSWWQIEIIQNKVFLSFPAFLAQKIRRPKSTS